MLTSNAVQFGFAHIRDWATDVSEKEADAVYLPVKDKFIVRVFGLARAT